MSNHAAHPPKPNQPLVLQEYHPMVAGEGPGNGQQQGRAGPPMCVLGSSGICTKGCSQGALAGCQAPGERQRANHGHDAQSEDWTPFQVQRGSWLSLDRAQPTRTTIIMAESATAPAPERPECRQCRPPMLDRWHLLLIPSRRRDTTGRPQLCFGVCNCSGAPLGGYETTHDDGTCAQG